MSESFLAWDPAQVAQHFLLKLGEDLRSSFIGNNIDGSLLPFLTTGHLRELGVELLASRLRLKKKINELLASQYTSGALNTLQEGNMQLKAIDINSNYVSMEALSLCVDLLRDVSLAARHISDEAVDMKKLNENFNKLRIDLNPVIRLVKESKPLPTPTLDPGAYALLPTHSVSSIHSTQSWPASDSKNGQTPTTASTLVLPGSSPNKLGFVPPNATVSPSNAPTSNLSLPGSSLQASSSLSLKTSASTSALKQKLVPSPTQSNRYSYGSVLSIGVGKIPDLKMGSANRFPSKPRLVDEKASSAGLEDSHDGHSQKLLPRQPSSAIVRSAYSRSKPSSSLVTSTSSAVQPSLANQPLKQLKASSDDTCLKVLQHAMKRHHIPREKWSKYVLVVCYDDKERILKLTEKPVLIFKELQEYGQNPTIMLRERASTSDDENDYEDARIGEDVPGGML